MQFIARQLPKLIQAHTPWTTRMQGRYIGLELRVERHVIFTLADSYSTLQKLGNFWTVGRRSPRYWETSAGSHWQRVKAKA